MSQRKYENDKFLYAKYFSELPLTATRYLTIRDVPQLIKQYVGGKIALDYGCGSGQSTGFLKSLGLHVESVDINEYMIKFAKEADPFGKYDIIESGKVPKEANFYDLVYASWVLVHASSKDELLEITQEIVRVLKDGGTLIAIVDSEDTFDNNDWVSVDTRFKENQALCSGSVCRMLYKRNNYVVYSYHWTMEDYLDALTKAGLTVVKIHQPLGKDDEGFEWINEKLKPYVNIFVAQKL